MAIKKLREPSRELLQNLSGNVRRLRKEQRMSQEELAHACGLHRTYIGSVERGERNVTLSSLEAISGALGISIAELFQPRKGAE